MRWLVLGLVMAFSQGAAAQMISERFDALDLSRWSIADYRFSHPAFDTDWSRDRLWVKNGLVLDLQPQSGAENRFSGASLRTHEKTHYGRYTVSMKPAEGEGIVTGFFTYTGPHYGTRHDEIDIEFLGKDTTQIHIATFVDGELWNKFIDLGFDASDAVREYSFEWAPDAIRWYVGDQLIYEKTDAEGAIPSVPGRLFSNIWAADPSVKIWSGEVSEGVSAQAKVTEITHIPALTVAAN